MSSLLMVCTMMPNSSPPTLATISVCRVAFFIQNEKLLYSFEIGFPHIIRQYRKHESFQPSENNVYPYAQAATS